MVAKLPPPQHESTLVVQNVIEERVKHRDFYLAMQNDWMTRIQYYVECRAEPRLIEPLDLSLYISSDRVEAERQRPPRHRESHDPTQRLIERRKTSLIGLYYPDPDRQPFQILETLRKGHNLLFCPCCGEPGKPRTLDHYLPKTIYPEFSIVLANLTPMCDECQAKKGTNYADVEGNKKFIHPYFDPIETVLLELRISEPFSSPVAFTVAVPDSLDLALSSLVARHIEGINFVERFEEFCRQHYTNLLMMFVEERKEPEPDSSTRIITRFLRQYEKESVNRWESVFYRGVLANQNLLNYLDNGDLPDFL